MLNPQEIALVQSTLPILEANTTAITKYFYERMFTHNPELKNIFNMSNQHTGRQASALFNAILAYAKNLDNLEVLTPVIERINHKHASLNIQPHHYPIVGTHLIETFRELTGELFTPDLESAWSKAYQQLANLFMSQEKNLYANNQQSYGGWKGARKFRLTNKHRESELVTSFTFEPIDEQAVMTYKPGQYIGIRLNIDTQAYQAMRQYSLSNKPNGKTYRISVKREVEGIASNYLHDSLNIGDTVELFAPAGDFFFIDKQAPVSLISAGVGLTPMQAMLEHLAKQQYPYEISYLHACHNKQQHSFSQRIKELSSILNLYHHTWYMGDESPVPDASIGYMNLNLCADKLPLKEGDFYLCGPIAFMKFVKNQLLSLGVENQRIHYEAFGPHADL